MKPTKGPFRVQGPDLLNKSFYVLAPVTDTGWAPVLAVIDTRNVPTVDEARANAEMFAKSAEVKALLRILIQASVRAAPLVSGEAGENLRSATVLALGVFEANEISNKE